jgi:hypothetical protein
MEIYFKESSHTIWKLGKPQIQQWRPAIWRVRKELKLKFKVSAGGATILQRKSKGNLPEKSLLLKEVSIWLYADHWWIW